MKFFKPPSSARTWTIGTLTYTFSGIVTLFSLLLLGDFANNIKGRSVYQMVQLMFKTYGASDLMNSLLITSLPCALGFLLVPVVSVHSDHCRTRWGRRIPYLALTTPVAALSIAGFAYSPALGSYFSALLHTDLNGTILFMLGLFWCIFEAATVISGAIFTALINDIVPRELLGRFFGLFAMVSLLCGIIFNFWFLGLAATHTKALFLAVAITYGVGFMYMCLKVKEGSYPAPEKKKRRDPVAAIRTYFRECYSKPYYLLIYLFLVAFGLVNIPVNAFSMFYAQQLKIDMDVYGKFLAVTYMISFVLSYFLGILADRIHPLRATIICLFLYGVMGCTAYFFIHDTRSFGIAFILHGVLAGSIGTSSASLRPHLFPKAQFAQFVSAGGILGCLALILLLPIFGKFLDTSGHKYAYTFLTGGLLALFSVLTGLILYAKWKHHRDADAGNSEQI